MRWMCASLFSAIFFSGIFSAISIIMQASIFARTFVVEVIFVAVAPAENEFLTFATVCVEVPLRRILITATVQRS
jgi:hypothetical protein